MLGFAAPATIAPCTLPAAFITPQGIETLRIASAGYASGAADTPANTGYTARLLGDVVLSQSALDAVGVGGRVALGIGAIDLWDGDGQLADLARYGTADGRRVVIRVAPASQPRASDVGSPLGLLPAAWRGVVAGVDGAASLRARLTVADTSQLLATPLQSSRYLGTGGLEGPTTLAGAPRPVCLGHVYNVSPVALGAVDLGDGSLLTYQTNWRSVAAHDAVRIRRIAVYGAELTPGQVAALASTGSTIDAAAMAFDSGTIAAEVSDDSGGNLVLVLPAPASGRYLLLDLAASGATALDIGCIIAGPLWRPQRSYAYGIVEGRQINDRVDINPLTGARFPVPALANPRFARFTLPLLTTAEARGEFRVLTRALGGVGDLLWIPETALDQAELNNRSLWGAAAAPGDLAGVSHDSFVATSRSFQIIERV